MLNFRPLTLSDAPLLKRYFDQSHNRLCDQTLGGALMWRNGFSTLVAEADGCLFFSSLLSSGERAFTPPLGDFEKGMALLSEHLSETGEEMIFCSVGEEEKEKILLRFPEMTAIPTRDWFDYLYSAAQFKGFPGKKLSGQRNHRNFFLKNNPHWHFEEITPENVEKAREFFLMQSAEVQKDSSYFEAEKEAVLEVLSNLSVYGFVGGMIVSGGEIVAISFGEVVGDTLFIHIEKATRTVRGSYQMMVSEFVTRYATEKVLYVNREEDVGDAGLRYSKESYHPERLLAKYILK